MAAIAEEIKHRKAERKTEVILAVGLPLSSFGREKQGFREYLLRKEQPVRFLYESEWYEIQIKDVKLFPQGYSALALHPEYLKNEPSVLLVDIGGWTVDLMRLDNAVPNAATCRSLELGVIRCIDETAEQVRRNTGLSVTETQIERVLRRESCSMAEEARRIICSTYGHTLVLFTSYHLMGNVYQMLRDEIPFPMIEVWRHSPEEITRFKQMDNAVLFAAGSVGKE